MLGDRLTLRGQCVNVWVREVSSIHWMKNFFWDPEQVQLMMYFYWRLNSKDKAEA